MTPVVDMNAFFAEPDQFPQLFPTVSKSRSQDSVIADCQLLNTQALIEYRFLKSRLISSVNEANKFFELDDQIIVQEYKFCTSLSYHQRVFVMEFRQSGSQTLRCNHVLELIFRGAATDINNDGYSTLHLAKENKQFVWRQFHSVIGGPFSTSRILVGLILRWLQNDNSRSQPVLTLG